MRSAMYQGRAARLLHDVASPQHVEDEDEESVMDSSTQVGQELRDAVAKVLHVDAKDLAPRR